MPIAEVAEQFPRAKSGRDQRQIMADTLIDLMSDEKSAPWRRPWDNSAFVNSVPRNIVSGSVYTGMNAMWLGFIQMTMGTDDGRWLTFKGGRDKGYQIKKGSKSVRLFYVNSYQPKDKETGKPEVDEKGKPIHLPIFRTFDVFHASDFEDIPEPETSEDGLTEKPAKEIIEEIVRNSGAKIRDEHLSNSAHFMPMLDSITLPRLDQFQSEAGYISTILHELSHWTGTKSRLDRHTGDERFGNEDYGSDELVAEMSSYFVARELGLPFEPAQHAAYVKSWSRGDAKKVRDAIAQAEEAANFLIAFARTEEAVSA